VDEVAPASARADGERATAAALRRLPPTFTIVHGLLTMPGGPTVDHLVIGPTGVWVVGTRNWAVVAEVERGELRSGRFSQGRDLDTVVEQAALVRDRLQLDANPMLCFVNGLQPRPAMMVGRVRLMTLDTIVDHIVDGAVTLTEVQVRWAVEQARDWQSRPAGFVRSASPGPPRHGAAPAPSLVVSSGRSHRGLRLVAMMLLGLMLFSTLAYVGAHAVALVRTDSDAASDVTTADVATPGLDPATGGDGPLRVEVECPTAGAGYRLAPTVGEDAARAVRISATVAGASRYLGEFVRFEAVPPIDAVAAASTVRFEVQAVDGAGRGGEVTPVDITVPTVPC